MTQSQSPESDDDSPGPSSPAVNGTHSNGPASLANGPYQDKLQHSTSNPSAASLFPNGNTNGPNITQVRAPLAIYSPPLGR